MITIKLIILSVLSLEINTQMYWSQLYDTLSYTSHMSKPPPRKETSIGFDRERNRLIIFGGCQVKQEIDEYPIVFDDTWEFNLNKSEWKEISMTSVRPLARYSMTYAHNRFGLYVSCGRGVSNEIYNDLWMFEFSSNLWRKLEQLGPKIPESRYSASGGIYPNYEELNTRNINNFFMSHGQSTNYMFDNVFRYGFTDARNLNGIWRENYKNRLGAFSADSPHSRYGHSSIMISPESLLLFGGCLSGKFSGGPCPSSDSWLYEASSNKWTRIDSSIVVPKLYSSMASLVSDGQKYSAILFGGKHTDRTVFATKEDNENEVVVYDDLYMKWTKKRVQGFYFPESRYSHVMCTGKLNNAHGIFLFGGYGHRTDGTLADLWFLHANVTTALLESQSINVGNAYHFTSIHLHATLMFTGWAVFINLGAFIARYMKDSSGKWIKYHRLLQTIGLILVALGIFFGFWSAHGVPHLAHAFIGVAAFLFALLQPITAMLKQSQKFDYYIDDDYDNNKEKKSSKFFSKFRANRWGYTHRFSGRFALILASVNMSLGVFYAVLHWFWWIVWFSFLGSTIVVYLITEIKQSFSTKAKKNTKLRGDDTLDRTFSSNNLKSNTTTLEDLTVIGDNIRLEPLNDLPRRYVDRNPKTPPPPYTQKRSQSTILKESLSTFDTDLSTISPHSSPKRTQAYLSSMPKKSNLKKTNLKSNPNFEFSPSKNETQSRYLPKY